MTQKNRKFDFMGVLESLLVLMALFAFGCTSMKDFQGIWEGTISEDTSVRTGFSENTEMRLNIQHTNTRKLEATITTCVRNPEDNTCSPGNFASTPLETLEKAQNDTLNTLTFGGEPYAVFLMTAKPMDPEAHRTLVFVSLHNKNRVEVRILRGQELYGVFRLVKPDSL